MRKTTHKANITYVKGIVDSLIKSGNADSEASHGTEDDLLLELVRDYAPIEIVHEINRLKEAELTRWYASPSITPPNYSARRWRAQLK